MTDESVDLSFLPEILDEDQFTFADSDTESHSTDWGTEDFSDTVPGPDAVVYPKDTHDVSRLLSQANNR
ncbi:MAG: hypothetical protein SV760_03985, partial [Halobacteria archaeon]|nr:hypothetical protein [Halobacteria archaeon]